MTSRQQWIRRALGAAAILALGLSLAPASLAGSTGQMYIYYETAALQVETGAKLVCPGGTYYDQGPGGSYQETPYLVVETMNCPPAGGGGSGGG
ncbi:MAG: hypothetical protein AAFY88_28830, partial [Acidobacteriota bacterium]